jgi:hypothetical protein
LKTHPPTRDHCQTLLHKCNRILHALAVNAFTLEEAQYNLTLQLLAAPREFPGAPAACWPQCLDLFPPILLIQYRQWLDNELDSGRYLHYCYPLTAGTDPAHLAATQAKLTPLFHALRSLVQSHTQTPPPNP